MQNNNPIGFFDSGVGGLSVWKEVNMLLPGENTIYLADSKNAPYGVKSKEEIIELSIKNTAFLLRHNCKMIVVACNTATTNAIAVLREKFSIPFVGIEPATKPAAINSKTGKIGVLATKGTLGSELFISTSYPLREKTQIIEVEGKGLVRLIEAGKLKETKPILQHLLQPLIAKKVDNLVLGCTHYPFLKPILEEILPPEITIVDAGVAVAKRTKTVLNNKQDSALNKNKGKHQFITNFSAPILQEMLLQINVKTKVKMVDF